MAEILFRLKNNYHPDPETDRRGSYKKGYPVSIKPDGWYEGNPYWSQSAYADKTAWIVIKCPEATVEECQQYVKSWDDNFDYKIVSSTRANGQYVVCIFETNVSRSMLNGITQAKVNTFLTNWGCSDISSTTNSVQFTFSLWSAVRSESFWEVLDIKTKGSFVLNNYISASGIGNITFTVLPSEWRITKDEIIQSITRKIQERGGTVTSKSYPAFTFEIERSDILTKFRQDIKMKAEGIYKRRQYTISESLVDSIASSGGVITMTKSKLLAAIKNGLDD